VLGTLKPLYLQQAIKEATRNRHTRYGDEGNMIKVNTALWNQLQKEPYISRKSITLVPLIIPRWTREGVGLADHEGFDKAKEPEEANSRREGSVLPTILGNHSSIWGAANPSTELIAERSAFFQAATVERWLYSILRQHWKLNAVVRGLLLHTLMRVNNLAQLSHSLCVHDLHPEEDDIPSSRFILYSLPNRII
jgi:hypothetical protein